MNEITVFVHKIILILLLTGFLAPDLLAQSNSAPLYKSKSEENLYKSKIGRYRKMRNAGIGLGVGGAVLTTVGIVMLSNADWVEDPSATGTGTYTTDDTGSAAGGILCLFTGIPLLGTGAVLGGIGGYKMKQYQRKLEGMTLNFKYTPYQRGVAFAYRF
jgi:hypothetical protein